MPFGDLGSGIDIPNRQETLHVADGDPASVINPARDQRVGSGRANLLEEVRFRRGLEMVPLPAAQVGLAGLGFVTIRKPPGFEEVATLKCLKRQGHVGRIQVPARRLFAGFGTMPVIFGGLTFPVDPERRDGRTDRDG